MWWPCGGCCRPSKRPCRVPDAGSGWPCAPARRLRIQIRRPPAPPRAGHAATFTRMAAARRPDGSRSTWLAYRFRSPPRAWSPDLGGAFDCADRPFKWRSISTTNCPSDRNVEVEASQASAPRRTGDASLPLDGFRGLETCINACFEGLRHRALPSLLPSKNERFCWRGRWTRFAGQLLLPINRQRSPATEALFARVKCAGCKTAQAGCPTRLPGWVRLTRWERCSETHAFGVSR